MQNDLPGSGTSLPGNQVTSSGYGGTGANIDVVYHRANWKVNPNNSVNSITGSVTTYFKTIQPNVSVITFDLNKGSFDNSSLIVKYHGITCSTSFPSSGNTDVLSITLPSVIAANNSLDSIVIDYSGIPEMNGFGGLTTRTYTDQHGTTQRYTFSFSESYEDRDWWPCKADMQDKIDSMDISVTVPWKGTDTFWVASNGVLTDSSVTDTLRTFSYKSRYPMASYLVCFAAAKYNRYYSNVQVGNTDIPVYWYLLAGHPSSYYTGAMNEMVKMNDVLQAYSNKFGDYPFKKEKHGYYDGLIGSAGMENQTFSAISSSALQSSHTLAHELMHQWFGDNVTIATWNDLWLAEGFASYGELIAAESVSTLGYNAYTNRNVFKTKALLLDSISTWIPDSVITTTKKLWGSPYGAAVYPRGCMVVSMLRAICGDEIFFQVMKNYQSSLSGRAASTESVKQYFNNGLGMDISEFFKDYVGGSGYGTTSSGGIGNPVYQVKWNSPSANKLLLGVASQTRTAKSNVAYFNGPVVVRVIGNNPATQDTTITFFDWGNGDLSYAGNGISQPQSGNVLSYDLSFTPDSMIYDDSAITLSTGTAVMDNSLQGYTWFGDTNTDWLNASNWSECCGIPPSGADVIIATNVNNPVLPASVSVRNLTINPGKAISIADNTLTINGSISGTGTITGSSASSLVLTGNAGTIYFSQGSSSEHSLLSLNMQQGSKALLANDAEVTNLNISPSAGLTVAPGVNLVTH